MPILVSLGARPGASAAASLVGNEPARLIEQPEPDQPGDRVDQPGAAQAAAVDVADDVELHFVGGHRHDLDGPVRGPHAAADRRALEGRARRCRGREQPLAVPEHDLAVRADVHEQPDARVAVHARREQAGHDVAAHICAEGGEHDGAGPRVDADPDLGREQFGEQSAST